MTEAPTLYGSGVVLRQLKTADATALFAAHSDPETHRYWSSAPHKDVDETAAYLEETLAMSGVRAWAITENGGEALGRIALFDIRQGVGEIGVIMRREATGRGLASRALDLVSEYGISNLGLHRLAADVDPDNTASLALFLRAGFQPEGLLRGNWKSHLGIRDSIILGKLRSP